MVASELGSLDAAQHLLRCQGLDVQGVRLRPFRLASAAPHPAKAFKNMQKKV